MTIPSVFREVPIEQLCKRVTTGATPLRGRADYYEGGTVDWYKTGELNDWYLAPAEERITEKALKETSAKLFPAETILMAMYGDGNTITSLGILRTPAATNQACSAMLVDETKCNPSYFFYALKGYRHLLLNIASGGAQRNLSGKLIKEFKLPVPSLTAQRRIARILSAYDELIENSQRRIHLLEAMASAVYREWFVHFHFPGYQDFRRIASPLGDIPPGWEATTLGAQLTALESGKRPKGGIRPLEDGVPSIGAENIRGIGRHDFAGEKRIPREFFQAMRLGIVRDRDVAIYKDGAYIGKSSYFRDGFPHSECCVNEHVFLLRANGVRLKQNALYLWLQEPDTVHAIRATNANAAQPGINQRSVRGLELVVPDERTAAHFDRLVEPVLAEIITLAKRIQHLHRIRDLLLPRLLSGQVSLDRD